MQRKGSSNNSFCSEKYFKYYTKIVYPLIKEVIILHKGMWLEESKTLLWVPEHNLYMMYHLLIYIHTRIITYTSVCVCVCTYEKEDVSMSLSLKSQLDKKWTKLKHKYIIKLQS